MTRRPVSRAPLGVFDSGVGGLSVLAALARLLPHEDFIYLGDTARVPYGSKPLAMVRGSPLRLVWNCSHAASRESSSRATPRRRRVCPRSPPSCRYRFGA